MVTAQELLPDGYGYILLVFFANVVVVVGLGIKVGMARKKYSVSYPQMYHNDPKHVFNCIQRVHQNTCEGQASFLFSLGVGGLFYPVLMAGLGAGYVFSRLLYAQGYYTGDPSKRQRGAFGSLLFLVMCLITAYGGLQLLGYV